MKKRTLEILNRVADLLDQIPSEQLLDDMPVPDGDMIAQTDYTATFLHRRYLEFEQDPTMRRVYGAVLRADTILKRTDLQWRQRSQWRDWFMVEYYRNEWWKPDTVNGPGGKFRPADPRNWWPVQEEDV